MDTFNLGEIYGQAAKIRALEAAAASDEQARRGRLTLQGILAGGRQPTYEEFAAYDPENVGKYANAQMVGASIKNIEQKKKLEGMKAISRVAKDLLGRIQGLPEDQQEQQANGLLRQYKPYLNAQGIDLPEGIASLDALRGAAAIADIDDRELQARIEATKKETQAKGEAELPSFERKQQLEQKYAIPRLGEMPLEQKLEQERQLLTQREEIKRRYATTTPGKGMKTGYVNGQPVLIRLRDDGTSEVTDLVTGQSITPKPGELSLGNAKPIPPGEKPATEAQTKMGLFGAEMVGAEQTFNRLEKEGYVPELTALSKPIGWASDKLGGSPYAGLSEKGQEWMNAEDTWLRGLLRTETGAAYRDMEVSDIKKALFPRKGESATVHKQKKRMRGILNEMMRKGAGPLDATIDKVTAMAEQGVEPESIWPSTGSSPWRRLPDGTIVNKETNQKFIPQ